MKYYAVDLYRRNGTFHMCEGISFPDQGNERENLKHCKSICSSLFPKHVAKNVRPSIHRF